MSTKSRKRKQQERINKSPWVLFTVKFLNNIHNYDGKTMIISKSRAEGKSHELCMNILRQGEYV